MIIRPGDEEVAACLLSKFDRKQATTVAKLLRQHYALGQGGTPVDKVWLSTLKTQLSLPRSATGPCREAFDFDLRTTGPVSERRGMDTSSSLTTSSCRTTTRR